MRDRMFVALLALAAALIVCGVATFSIGVALIVAGVLVAGLAALTLFADDPKPSPAAAAVPAWPAPTFDLQPDEIA